MKRPHFIFTIIFDCRKTVTFLVNNLTVLDILQQFNKHISSLTKPEELSASSAPLTKLEKKKRRK